MKAMFFFGFLLMSACGTSAPPEYLTLDREGILALEAASIHSAYPIAEDEFLEKALLPPDALKRFRLHLASIGDYAARSTFYLSDACNLSIVTTCYPPFEVLESKVLCECLSCSE